MSGSFNEFIEIGDLEQLGVLDEIDYLLFVILIVWVCFLIFFICCGFGSSKFIFVPTSDSIEGPSQIHHKVKGH